MFTKLASPLATRTIEPVASLDLDPIKVKLMDHEDGQGWSRTEADRIEIEYRRFLTLVAKYPDETIAPNREVDKFWHAHILDTAKYADDCDKTLGYFLHHFPYFGMRGAEDAANLATAGEITSRLYEQEFGATPARATAYCAAVTDSVDAYCAAVASSSVGAYCAAVAKSEASAYCAAVAKSDATAYCAAVAKSQSRAHCAAVANSSANAYCAAVGKSQAPAYCAAVSRPTLDVTARPSLDQHA